MDNIFLASLLGCAFALVIAFVIFRMWLIAKVAKIYKSIPDEAKRAFGIAGDAAEHAFKQHIGDNKPAATVVVPPPPPELTPHGDLSISMFNPLLGQALVADDVPPAPGEPHAKLLRLTFETFDQSIGPNNGRSVKVQVELDEEWAMRYFLSIAETTRPLSEPAA